MRTKILRIEPAKTPNGYYTIDRIAIRPLLYGEHYDLEGIPVRERGTMRSLIRSGCLLPYCYDVRDVWKDGIGWDDSEVETAARKYITETLGYRIIDA